MHGSVFLDEAGEVIRPALLWNDQRTAAECAEIEERAGGREALVRMVANPALTGFTAPKLLWVRRHEPANWDRVRQVLLPKDYIRYRLTGTYATEVSDASGTLLLDVANRRWSRELLGKLDLDPALLPPCYESPEVSGEVSETGVEGDRACQWARRWSAAAATSRPGRWATGSSARAWSRRRWGPRAWSSPTPTSSASTRWAASSAAATRCRAPGTSWASCSRPGAASSGSATSWARPRSPWPSEQGVDPYFLLTDEAALAGPGPEGLFFLPYLTGERTPHFDPDAKGAWIGLTVRHGRPHMIRSVLEGATFAMRDSLELIREMGVGDRPDPRLRRRCPQPALAADPGRYLRLRRPHPELDRRARPSASPCWPRSAPAAFASVPEACDATIRAVESTAVDPKVKAFYDRAYAVYRQLYHDLRESFRSISELVARQS